MAVARAQRIRRASVNVVDAQRGVARGGDVLLVGSDLQLVHLRVRVLHRLVAHPGGRLPQTDRVVIAGRREEDTAHPSPVLSVGWARNLLTEPWPKLVRQREDALPARARRFTDALTPPRKFRKLYVEGTSSLDNAPVFTRTTCTRQGGNTPAPDRQCIQTCVLRVRVWTRSCSAEHVRTRC